MRHMVNIYKILKSNNDLSKIIIEKKNKYIKELREINIELRKKSLKLLCNNLKISCDRDYTKNLNDLYSEQIKNLNSIIDYMKKSDE